ncbi:MAG: DUF262 domain-containing protein [Nanoarchaeota archaeon]|nr:DUF262 domain-containing protein [Nanoarchaeota archaeon]
MAKPKIMYPLKGIFTSLLEDTEKNKFMIPTYQRGYKWTSSGDNNHVDVLMRDLRLAFERSISHRYYLQFITLKDNGVDLEVIDGQQRLITLTILFSVLGYFLENKEVENFVTEKLKYQVRENFVKKYIYDNINLLLESESWNRFVKSNPEHDNQDVFYIYHATKAIHKFIENEIPVDQLKEFFKYLCNQVFLIVNLLEKNIKSEKIFINVNKGVKLKDEDLVKGLLITKIPLDNQTLHYRMTENEINEVRANMGRQWDDLARWSSRDTIIKFFKSDYSDNNRLGWLIQLTYPEVQNTNDSYPMFSYLDDLYRTKKETATEIFTKIRKTMLTLNDWFGEPEICNLLGYLLHARKSSGIKKIWIDLNSCCTKAEILQKLKSLCKELLPINKANEELQELNYDDFKSELFDLFLMLDVAKFLPIGNRKAIAYDFSKISAENWSIEHVFPQNAKDFKNLDNLSKADLEIIKELLPTKVKDIVVEQEDKREAILTLYKKLKKAKNECLIGSDELELLENLLDKNAADLHKLGNLTLLQQGMNSGLSNHYFDGKRKIIVLKVSDGEFVPYHTYDVFSKLVIETVTGLHVWSKDDITKHEEFIRLQIGSVVNYLNLEN